HPLPLSTLPPSPTRRSSDLLVVGCALAHVARRREAHHLPRPREERELFEVHDDVTVEGERRPRAPELQRHPRLGAYEFDRRAERSEEHTSELQSRFDLVCRL